MTEACVCYGLDGQRHQRGSSGCIWEGISSDLWHRSHADAIYETRRRSSIKSHRPAERCNCDASCGENRYHDIGDPGCRFVDEDEYNAYWARERARYGKKSHSEGDYDMAKDVTNKVSIRNKLTKVNENFSVNMYDNGYMIEVSGRDKKDDYKTSKLMLGSVEELIEVIKEITLMERVD